MTSKKGNNKKTVKLKKIRFLDPKIFNLNKLKINPTNIVEDTKSKLGSYYTNLKNEWEKNQKRKEIKRQQFEKKELEKQKNYEKKAKLEKLKEEKS